MVEDKQRRLVRFKLNSAQKQYNNVRTNRDIILKARQQGFSSFILAIFTIECLEVPNTRAVVISHDKEATRKMLDKVKMYVKRFYDDEKLVEISTETENKQEIRFTETNSTFYIGTAGAKTFGRGDTIHLLHLSEFAFYENPDEITMGAMQAVPDDGVIIIETTANGYNHFRKLWYNSKRNKTDYKTHFFGWQEHKEYERETNPLTDYDADELELKKRIPGITDKKLAWRRKKLQSLDGDIKKLHQEYPSTDSESFISSGNKVFNSYALNKKLKEITPPLAIGDVSQSGSFSTNPDGNLKIYKYRQPGRSYVIGADVSEGISTGDFDAAHVLDWETSEIVAVWHGKVPPDTFGEYLVGLGTYYNQALIGCEINNHGFTTNIKIRDLDYANQYTRVEFDKTTEKTTEKLGWETNRKTKPVVINTLAGFVRDDDFPICDEETILELLSYQELPKTSASNYVKMAAATGGNDDRVISLAIAIQMRKYNSPPVTNPNVTLNYIDNIKPNENQRAIERI